MLLRPARVLVLLAVLGGLGFRGTCRFGGCRSALPIVVAKICSDSLGSIGAVMGNIALDDAIVSIPLTNLRFLPAGAT
jgi:hypothetical protein